MVESNVIGSGTAAGAVQYLDFLSNKGHLVPGAVRALKTAFIKVTKTLGGDDWEQTDIRSIDLDEYMARFANMTHGQYNTASLADYKTRVRKVLTWYTNFLSTPGWAPDVKVRARPQTAKPDSVSVRSTASATTLASTADSATPVTVQPAPATVSKLIAFPFPLSDGTLANLYLPASITRQDAKRMARFVETLVIDGTSDE